MWCGVVVHCIWWDDPKFHWLVVAPVFIHTPPPRRYAVRGPLVTLANDLKEEVGRPAAPPPTMVFGVEGVADSDVLCGFVIL